MKNIKTNQYLNSGTQGFTLLVAMIVTALILAIGFSIGSIILKELALSASGRQSQVAFYAADSMSECALYWDKKDAAGNPITDIIGSSLFATDTPAFTTETLPVAIDPATMIQCGTGVDPTKPGSIGNFVKEMSTDGAGGTTGNPNDNLYATTSFSASFSDPVNPTSAACAQVTIAKNITNTVIEARGYNVDYIGNVTTGGCDILNPRTVERGLLTAY